MASTIQNLYPATSSVALTLTAASLASDTNLLAGRASTAANNVSSNLDLDVLVSGNVVTGTSPTGGVIEVWAYASRSTSSGTPTYPDTITGTDSNTTLTSANTKYPALALVASIAVDTTSNRSYDFKPTSIAQLFGQMPKFWGLFVVQSTGVALNSTGHSFQYERVQAQSS